MEGDPTRRRTRLFPPAYVRPPPPPSLHLGHGPRDVQRRDGPAVPAEGLGPGVQEGRAHHAVTALKRGGGGG